MYKKPITQKAKSSPFKQTVQAVKTDKGATRQETKKEEYKETGDGNKVDKAKGGLPQAKSAGDYLKNLSVSDKFKGVSGQEMVDKGYISNSYLDQWNDMTNYTPPTVTKTREVTTTVKDPDTKSNFTPQIEDTTKRVGTVGDYRNNLMVNRSINRDKNLEKKQQRDLAKEYARQSDGRNGLFGNWRERRDFMKGNVSNEDIVSTFDALNEKTGGMSGTGAEKLGQYQQNYATMRGLTADQQNLSKSAGVDRALAQYEQGGNEEISQFRDFENKDFGTERGTMTKDRIEKNTGYVVEPGNVSTTQTSPGTTNTSVSETSSASTPAANVPATNKVNGTGAANKPLISMRTVDEAAGGGLSQSMVNQTKALDMGAAAANQSKAAAPASNSASISDASAGVAAAGTENAPRKNWRDRAQSTIENARAKRAERQAIKSVESEASSDYKTNKKEQRMRERGQVDKDGNVITRKQMRQNRKAGEAAYKADQDFQAAVNQVGANANKYETNLESVPEAPDNATFDASYRPENKVAAAGMAYEGTKLEYVPEEQEIVNFQGDKILAKRKADAATKAKALEQANSMKANTGTANRSSYNRTSAPLVDGTPTRENRPPMSPAEMRFEQNVGIKQRSPMKKGYFKGK